MSATSIRTGIKPFESPDRPPLRDGDSKERFSFRGKADGDNERKDSRNANLRPIRRTDGEDSEGWSTVKPRKSFGTEGAERFTGRMGVQDRRFKDKEERDAKDKPRTFESFSRDVKDGKDTDHEERDNRVARNGIGRGRNEPTWREREANKEKDNDVPPVPRDRNSNGDRLADRNRGWREKDREDTADRGGRRNDQRERGDRNWGRERREDKDPEWMDEPLEEKSQARTQEDFQKWKEQMHLDKGSKQPTPAVDEMFKPDAGASFFGLEKEKVDTPLAIDSGPDKFFGMWGAKEEVATDSTAEKEGPVKAKTTGKASRFTSFFSPQDEPQRRLTEPPPPIPSLPANGLEVLFGASKNTGNAQSNQEKEAFQHLLQKLQSQTLAGPPPQSNAPSQPKPPAPEKFQTIPASSPDPYQQYRQERQEEPRPSTRNQPSIQDILAQRQMAASQPQLRQEQMLQELIGQRQNNLSQPSSRNDPNRNNNTEFLMGLMQNARAAPEPQRTEQVLLRMPPKINDRQLQQQMMEREQMEMARERERERASRRPGPPPGFYEDPSQFQRNLIPQERQPPQPTQILQRPPPPGLDMGWDRQPQIPPQHQHRPPPGLQNAPPPQQQQQQQQNRGPGGGMIPQMFPPGFPVNTFPPPDGMPRNMMQPPPGFFGGPPPPGFMPPMNGFQGGPPGPDGFGGMFDGRGPPPPQQGGFRR